MTCNICYDDSIKPRERFLCPHCNTEFCKSCLKTWLTTTRDLAQCPNGECAYPWNQEVLLMVGNKHWYQAIYMKHREEVLFDAELSLIPSTQRKVRDAIECKQIETEFLPQLKKRYKQLLVEISVLKAEKKACYDNMIELNQRCLELRTGCCNTTEEGQTLARSMYCVKPDCGGTIEEGVCSTCGDTVCMSCLEIAEKGHRCDPEKIKSLQLIRSDTKPCPNCNEMITKIDGCSQMWCTRCKTGFDWNTGKIDNGKIHNPHYYEWMRTTYGDIPREQDVCEGLPDFYSVTRVTSGHPDIRLYLDYISSCHRMLVHIENVSIVALGVVRDNTDVRVKYMLKELDITSFKHNLVAREKLRLRNVDLRQIYQTLVIAGTDIFRQLIDDTDIDLLHYVIQLESLRLFINSALGNLCKSYGLVVQIFNYIWKEVSINAYPTNRYTNSESYEHFYGRALALVNLYKKVFEEPASKRAVDRKAIKELTALDSIHYCFFDMNLRTQASKILSGIGSHCIQIREIVSLDTLEQNLNDWYNEAYARSLVSPVLDA